ncbi:MAG: chemotaxis protein CheD [Defluviitaleaceae bacterium]|nr:chemotaxis protein CheD [Defluviitaleaceae bacterium]
MNNSIIVGMADLNAAKSPCVITTIGLGSCVGIALYDETTKIGGMAHVMLPSSKKIKNNSNRAKFVDTAVIDLIAKMKRMGSKPTNLKAKIAGGAQMFSIVTSNENMKIGDRNIEATLEILKELKIPIIGKDLGQNYGRTIELHTIDGKLFVKTIGHGIKIL